MEIEKGGYQALAWMNNFKLKNGFFTYFYDLALYRKFANSCSMPQMDQLNKNISLYGMHRGLHISFLALNDERVKAERDKREYIEQKNKELNINKDSWEYKRKELKMQEEERWSQLSKEEYRKIFEPYPDGMSKIPLSIIETRPVIEEKECLYGVKYKIYDKIHGAYCAVISSPWRREPSGVQGVIVLRDKALDFSSFSLRLTLDRVIRDEENKQSTFNAKQRDILEITQQNPQQNDQSVQKVRKIMGTERNAFGNDDLDGGDIF